MITYLIIGYLIIGILAYLGMKGSGAIWIMIKATLGLLQKREELKT